MWYRESSHCPSHFCFSKPWLNVSQKPMCSYSFIEAVYMWLWFIPWGSVICTCKPGARGGTGPAGSAEWEIPGLCRVSGSGAAQRSWPSKRRALRRRSVASERVNTAGQRNISVSRLSDFLFIYFLPVWPSWSGPPFCLWGSSLRDLLIHVRGSAETQSGPLRTGRRQERVWSEPWSCWCSW